MPGRCYEADTPGGDGLYGMGEGAGSGLGRPTSDERVGEGAGRQLRVCSRFVGLG